MKLKVFLSIFFIALATQNRLETRNDSMVMFNLFGKGLLGGFSLLGSGSSRRGMSAESLGGAIGKGLALPIEGLLKAVEFAKSKYTNEKDLDGLHKDLSNAREEIRRVFENGGEKTGGFFGRIISTVIAGPIYVLYLSIKVIKKTIKVLTRILSPSELKQWITSPMEQLNEIDRKYLS